MTGNEAYAILNKHYPTSRVRGCLDYGKFYVFCLAPIEVADSDEYFTGPLMDAVDKKTGRVYKYDISSDIGAYERAKQVKIRDMFSMPVTELKE